VIIDRSGIGSDEFGENLFGDDFQRYEFFDSFFLIHSKF